MSALEDLRRGITEHQALRAGKQKTFAKEVVTLILWENRNEILEALDIVDKLRSLKPRS